MGSSASKASRSAGQAARVYPKQASQAATRSPKPSAQAAAAPRASQPGPTVQHRGAGAGASEAKDETIAASDAQDPALAAKLRSIGAVQPNPYYSHNSTSPFDPRRPSESGMPDFSAGPNPFAPPPPGGVSAAAAATASAARPNRPTSMPNPALSILSARDRLQREAEADLENAAKPNAPGRRFLDPTLIRRVLVMRDREKKTDDAIEEEMGLERGFMKRLGSRSVVEAV